MMMILLVMHIILAKSGKINNTKVQGGRKVTLSMLIYINMGNYGSPCTLAIFICSPCVCVDDTDVDTFSRLVTISRREWQRLAWKAAN